MSERAFHPERAAEAGELRVLVLEADVGGEPSGVQVVEGGVGLELAAVVEAPGAEEVVLGADPDPGPEALDGLVEGRGRA